MNFMQSINDFLSKLPQIFPSITVILIVLLIFGLVLACILLLLVAFSGSATVFSPGKAKAKARLWNTPPLGGWVSKVLSLRGYFQVQDSSLSFLKVIDFLKEILGPGREYAVPWYLLIGSEGSGKTTLLESLSLPQPAGQPDFYEGAPNPPCKWWFFGKGIILDIQGKQFLSLDPLKTEEGVWRNLLVMLSRYRGARPLNGIILTISAKELYGRDKLKLDVLHHRAVLTAQKILLTQHALGIRLPVYVLITHCDHIPGFSSLCSEIPEVNRSNILGWSSPYTTDLVYCARWIQEAFDSIGDALSSLRLEIMTHSANADQMDGIFVLPQEVLKLQESLSVYLERVFQGEGYQTPPVLRGIYLCGDGGMEWGSNWHDQILGGISASDVILDSENDSVIGRIDAMPTLFQKKRGVFFIEDLLNHKIFNEFSLAEPQPARLITINRGLNLLKGSTAVFIILSTYSAIDSYQNFKHQKRTILPILAKIMGVMKDMNTLDMTTQTNSIGLFDGYARELLAMMKEIQKANFFSILVPASWFSSINEELHKGFSLAYQQTVIRTIYVRLLLKAKELLNLRPSQMDHSKTIATVLNPTTTPEYALLNRYVQGLTQLNLQINRFNTIKGAPSSTEFEALVSYAFSAKLPQEFIDHYSNFRELLFDMKIPFIDLIPYQKMARETLSALYQNFLNILFSKKTSNSLPSYITKIMMELGPRSQLQPDKPSFLSPIARDLSKVLPNLGEVGKTWLDSEYFFIGSDFDLILDQIDSSRLFGKDVTQYLVDQTAVGFQNLKTLLYEFNHTISAGEGDVVTAEKDLKIPSAGLIDLEKILSVLFLEPFMASPPPYYVPITDRIPKNKSVRWDDTLIRHACHLVKSYEEYVSKKIPTLPLILQPSILDLSKITLQKNIVLTLTKAQTLVDRPKMGSLPASSEEILKDSIGEFKAVSQEFMKLLDILSDDTVGLSFSGLKHLIASSTIGLLKRVDYLLEEFNPYALKTNSFAWWQGKAGATLDAYGVADIQDLQIYIRLQNQYIETLSTHFASAIIQLLKHPVLNDQIQNDILLITKWQRICEQIELMQKKSPNSSIGILENFLVVDLNSYTLEDCFSKINQSELSIRSGDFFLQTLTHIKQKFLERAEVLAREHAVAHYNTLRTYFNKKMRGSFPFIPGTKGDIKPDQTAECDLEVVREFFKLFDEFGGNSDKILNQVYQLGGSGEEARVFLKSLMPVRDFLKGFLDDPTEDGMPTYDINLLFRENRPQEKGGKFVVDWFVQIPDEDRITHTSKVKTIRWTAGHPLEIGFRWPRPIDTDDEDEEANSSQTMPAPLLDSGQSNLSIENQTAIFSYTGNWALAWLVRMHRVNQSISKKGFFPHVLKFSIPVSRGQGKMSTATLYDTIGIIIPSSAPKKPGTPVKCPEFPYQAPPLKQDILTHLKTPILLQKLIKTRIKQKADEPEESTKSKDSKSKKKEETPSKSEEMDSEDTEEDTESDDDVVEDTEDAAEPDLDTSEENEDTEE